MIYRSQITPKGNSAYSYTSQDEADAQAAASSAAAGCTNCTGCSGCTNCTGDVILAGRPNNWSCYGWLKDGKLMIHCGCRRFRLNEALAYWDRLDKPDRREVVAAVRYIASVAELRGWPL